ncbi:MAG: FAD-dependent oxidoreductase, partial [Limnospira sp. PMC 1295.21]|nr:FAD-dependent oxidoreductase [Limnospira sp. PMC 1295.21]
MDRDTQFSRKTAYVYAQDEADIEALRGEHDAARHLGLACQLVEEAGLPFRPPLLLAFAQQAQIDPAAYLAG